MRFFRRELGVVALLPGLRALERDAVLAQDPAEHVGRGLVHHAARHEEVRQLAQRPRRQRHAKVPWPARRDFEHLCHFLGFQFPRSTSPLTRAQCLETALVEQADQLAHILIVQAQLRCDVFGLHPLPAERDDLRSTQHHRTLRRPQNPRQLEALSAIQVTYKGTHCVEPSQAHAVVRSDRKKYKAFFGTRH